MNAAPPDPNGAPGARVTLPDGRVIDQYVQWVNEDFAVFDKGTGAIIYGPVPGNTLWSGFGGPCENHNDGDPIVQYDAAANRWVLAQFAVTGGPPFYYCVAVSTTPDATGSYARYAFQYTNFNDYAKVGVWPDAYYVSFNMFNGNNFVGSRVCAYDRAAMLNGSPATQQCFQLSSSFGGLLPSDLDGTIAPPAGSPNFFLAFNNNILQLWKFHVDWTNPSLSTLSGPTNIAVAPFTEACSGGTCIPQTGTAQVLDSLGDRLMYRVAYRRFPDGHEALVANHSVNPGNNTAGVRWYELRNPGGGTMANGTPVLYQQGTYAPDSTYRWMASMAMDNVGNIAVGYSVSSSAIHPGIRYTGRAPGDPLGLLGAETSLIEGTGSQTTGLERWGDYTSMRIDPSNDCTFWYTNQYLKTNGTFNWSTRIASFQFTTCPSNVAPTASPQNVSTNEDTATVLTLGALDPDSVSLTFAIGTGPTHGTLSAITGTTCTPAGGGSTCTASVTYTPAANFNGADSFTFTANDGTTTSAAATVAVTITPVNDAPTATGQSISVPANTGTAITLAGTDVETQPGNLSATIETPPAHGTLTGTGLTRTYTPTANYTGPDSFTFTMTDRGDPDNCGAPSASCAAALVSAAATVSITVNAVAPPPEIIIDNAPAGQSGNGASFTGTWCQSSVPPPFGATSLYNCGGGVDTYRWTPTMPAAGTYDVYVWWTAHAVRSAAVPITVVHAAGTTTLTFNEQINGGQWVLHGRYSFNAGTGGYVQVSDANVTGQISADAVRFVPAGSGGNPVPALTTLSPNGATAGGPAFTLTVTGTGFVSNSVVRWNGADRTTTFGSGTQVQAAITAGDIAAVGTIPVTVFTPTPGGGTSNALTFTITTGASQEIIIDNGTAGTSFTGSWCVSSVQPPYGANSLYNCGGGVDTYKWTPTMPAAGTYDVYVWWTAHAVRSAAAPITVVHAAGTTTLTFNEQINGGQWVLHGRYSFNAGTGGYVQVSDANVTGQISADAVRFVPAGSGGNPVPALTTLSPNGATAGGPAFTLTVTGTGFVSSSVVRWNGADRTTTFGSGTQVQAAITAGDIAAVGTIPVTVFTPTPGGGTSNALTFTITTGASQEIIIDNGTAGTSFTGTWCVSSVQPPYGANSLYNCGGGVDTYKWTPTMPAAGTYDVYVWWTAHAVRSAAAPITVVHAAGTTTKNFNEQINGGQWVLHGRYSFNAGTGGYVQVSDANVTGQISADAVRFVPVP